MNEQPTPQPTPDTYSLPAACSNCGHKADAIYKRGVQVHPVACPNCGCACLRVTIETTGRYMLPDYWRVLAGEQT